MRTGKHYFLIFISVLLMAGCKSSQDLSNNTLQLMPQSYTGKNDSINSAIVNWRTYFSDPFLIRLVDTALVNNWDALTALRRVEMSQSNSLLSKGAMRPVVQAAATAAQRKYGLYTMDGAIHHTEEQDDEIVPITSEIIIPHC